MDQEIAGLSQGYLVDKRLRYAQPLVGYRTGIEPVLLAAAVPARAGQRVLEAGCGAGAGLLCLAARVPGILGTGVERDPHMAAVAWHNFGLNGFDGLSVQVMDVMDLPAQPWFDHVFANPPWHAEASSASPDPGRDQAKRARAGLLEAWIKVLARVLKPGGTITLVLPAAQFAQACASLAAVGEVALLPLWPRAGMAAKLVLVSARKGRRGAARVLPGLVLHEGQGYSRAAELVLRYGEGLEFYPGTGKAYATPARI